MGLVYYASPLVAIAGVGLILYFIAVQVLNVSCQKCGHKNGKRKVFCDLCGVNLTQQPGFQESNLFDTKTLIFSFFIPLVGLYMWFFMREAYPHKSRYLWTSVIGGTVILAFNVWAGLFVGYYGYWLFYW